MITSFTLTTLADYVFTGWVDIAPNSDRTSINGILHWTVPDEESFVSIGSTYIIHETAISVHTMQV